MKSLSDIISEINNSLEELLSIMYSGDELYKCPYCKYEVYMRKEQLKKHIFNNHSLENDEIIHQNGDFLDEIMS
jgi:hypothetical protein